MSECVMSLLYVGALGAGGHRSIGDILNRGEAGRASDQPCLSEGRHVGGHLKSEESREFVLDFFRELASGDTRCWDRVADDATWQLVARAKDYPYPSDYTKASYRKLVEDSAHEFPNGLSFTITGTTAEGPRVALEAESYGTTRSGKLYNNFYHLLVQLESGQIKRVREYLDSGYAREVLG
jgi:uncharacterized protein